jgi:hypothetical protein
MIQDLVSPHVQGLAFDKEEVIKVIVGCTKKD